MNKIKGIKDAIILLITKKTKMFILIICIIIIGLFIFFNLNYNKKDGLVIKPSVKIEVKK